MLQFSTVDVISHIDREFNEGINPDPWYKRLQGLSRVQPLRSGGGAADTTYHDFFEKVGIISENSPTGNFYCQKLFEYFFKNALASFVIDFLVAVSDNIETLDQLSDFDNITRESFDFDEKIINLFRLQGITSHTTSNSEVIVKAIYSILCCGIGFTPLFESKGTNAVSAQLKEFLEDRKFLLTFDRLNSFSYSNAGVPEMSRNMDLDSNVKSEDYNNEVGDRDNVNELLALPGTQIPAWPGVAEFASIGDDDGAIHKAEKRRTRADHMPTVCSGFRDGVTIKRTLSMISSTMALASARARSADDRETSLDDVWQKATARSKDEVMSFGGAGRRSNFKNGHNFIDFIEGPTGEVIKNLLERDEETLSEDDFRMLHGYGTFTYHKTSGGSYFFPFERTKLPVGISTDSLRILTAAELANDLLGESTDLSSIREYAQETLPLITRFFTDINGSGLMGPKSEKLFDDLEGFKAHKRKYFTDFLTYMAETEPVATKYRYGGTYDSGKWAAQYELFAMNAYNNEKEILHYYLGKYMYVLRDNYADYDVFDRDDGDSPWWSEREDNHQIAGLDTVLGRSFIRRIPGELIVDDKMMLYGALNYKDSNQYGWFYPYAENFDELFSLGSNTTAGAESVNQLVGIDFYGSNGYLPEHWQSLSAGDYGNSIRMFGEDDAWEAGHIGSELTNVIHETQNTIINAIYDFDRQWIEENIGEDKIVNEDGSDEAKDQAGDTIFDFVKSRLILKSNIEPLGHDSTVRCFALFMFMRRLIKACCTSLITRAIENDDASKRKPKVEGGLIWFINSMWWRLNHRDGTWGSPAAPSVLEDALKGDFGSWDVYQDAFSDDAEVNERATGPLHPDKQVELWDFEGYRVAYDSLTDIIQGVIDEIDKTSEIQFYSYKMMQLLAAKIARASDTVEITASSIPDFVKDYINENIHENTSQFQVGGETRINLTKFYNRVQASSMQSKRKKLLLLSDSSSYLPAGKDISNEQILSMLKFLSIDKRGFLLDSSGKESSSGKFIMTIGLPNGFMKTIAEQEYQRRLVEDETIDTSAIFNSSLIKINVHRIDVINDNVETIPKYFIFDVNKYFLENIESVPETKSHFPKAKIKSTIPSAILNAMNIFHLAPDEQKYALASDFLIHENAKEIKANNRKECVFMNAVTDYYLKLYMRVVLGLDMDEDVFQFTELDNVSLSPGPDTVEQNNFSLYFEQPLDSILINLPQDNDYIRELNRIKTEAGRSIFFAPEKYLRRAIRPATFDRTLSVLIDENDFLTGDIADLEPEVSMRYQGELMGKGERYIDEADREILHDSKTTVYQYFCTVSLLVDDADGSSDRYDSSVGYRAIS